MNQKLIAALMSSAFLLSACGGRDGGSNDSSSNSNGNNNGGQTTPKPDVGGPSGSIVEPLDTSHTYTVLYDFPSSSGLTKNVEAKQTTNGTLTQFGRYQIKGDIVAKEIRGNKNFALARIAKGIIEYDDNGKVETTDVSKYSNGSYYYFAATPLAGKITQFNTTAQCTELNTTQAKLTNGKGNNNFITPTVRNANMSLKPNGQFNIVFTVNGNNSETTYTGELAWVDSFNSYNGFPLLGIQNQAGSSNQIGTFAISQNGPKSFVVGAIYKITLADQSQYQGLASMTCNF